MVLADSNVWLALVFSRHSFHSPVSDWLEKRPQSDTVVFCRATQQSFLRLLTTEAVAAAYGIPPLTNKAAWSVFEGIRGNPRISWADEPPGLETHWKRFGVRGIASPKLWMDAYLAAFAIAGDYQLVTTDKAFKQFKGLDLILLPVELA